MLTPAVDGLAAVALVSSLFYLISVGIVAARSKRRPGGSLLTLLYVFFSLLWALEQAVDRLGWLSFLRQDFLERLPIYGLLILAIFFLFLSRALLGVFRRGWGWLILGLGWTGGVLTLDVTLSASAMMFLIPGGKTVTIQALVFLLLIVGWAIYMGAATALTSQTLRQARRYYTVVTYWALVLILTVIGDGLFFSGYRTPASILRLAGTLLAVYVVSIPRLPDAMHVLRRSLSYLVYAFLAVGLFTAAFVLIQAIIPNWLLLSPLWISLGLAIALALLFNPLLNRIRRQVKRWISGDAQDAASLLRQYSQRITSGMDLNLLAASVVGTAGELLRAERGFLFLVEIEKGENHQDTIHLRGIKGMGDENPTNGKLRSDSPLTAYFRETYQPLSQAEIDAQPHFRDVSAEERQWLNSLGTEIYVPIHAKNEWIGLLTLGAKSSGGAYTGKDLALLSTLADQTAVAMENTRLVEGLVRLNNDFRRAYAALDQANRHLERLDKTKSDFISIASHELRTPLTLISGASQMLLDDHEIQKSKYHKQLLEKIHNGTGRLHEIVDSMLDVAKIDTRALELEPQPVSLSSLIQSVCEEIEKSTNERQQTIETRNLEALPSVTADIQALRKVFHHLIINAIKYTPDGGKITISGREVEPNLSDLPKGGVEITVSDTGIGIEPRYQELIFTKFYQTGELALHSSGKTKFKGGGPGLGLAIARGIVEAHQGRIWVESPGCDEQKCPGSQFHVVLPLRLSDRLVTPPMPRDLQIKP
jgi:signal transduction histidine kinase